MFSDNVDRIPNQETKTNYFSESKRQEIKIYPLAYNAFQDSLNIKSVVKKKDSIFKKKQQIIKTKPIKIQPNIPIVSYFGYIKSTYRDKMMILIKIENQLYKTKQNEKIQGIVINKIYKDSIQIQIGKIRKIVRINGKYD